MPLSALYLKPVTVGIECMVSERVFYADGANEIYILAKTEQWDILAK